MCVCVCVCFFVVLLTVVFRVLLLCAGCESAPSVAADFLSSSRLSGVSDEAPSTTATAAAAAAASNPLFGLLVPARRQQAASCTLF